MMQFAMIISGSDAPIPAPRIDAKDSIGGVGLYDESTGRILTIDCDQLATALPARLRRHYARNMAYPWFNNRSRIIGGRCNGDLPYLEICGRDGKRIETVYFAPVQS